ncbi:MAG TPA: hypothetical protein ENI77_04720 [Nitrospirae bacterium]|nr:hypothetical protein [Nitrospirota bacterium]
MESSFITVELTAEFKIENVPGPSPMTIHSVAQDVSGRIYCSDEFNHRIVVLDKAGKCVFAFGGKGNAPGEFWYPRGLALVDIGGSTQLAVCDAWNHRVQRFDLEGNFISAFGSIGDGENNFNEPVAVIPGNDGSLQILEKCNHRVKKHGPNGEYLGAFGELMTRETEAKLVNPTDTYFNGVQNSYGFNYPQAYAEMEDGSLIFADTGNRRLCRTTAEGVLLDIYKLDVEGNPPYRYPTKVEALGNGIILICGVNLPFTFLDLDRPWLESQNLIEADENKPPAFSLQTGDGDVTRMLSVDGWSGAVKTYSICRSAGLEEALPSHEIPGAGDIEEIPCSWTEMESDKWLLFIKRSPLSEKNIEFIRKYVDVNIHSARLAMQKAMEIEPDLCKIISGKSEYREKIHAETLKKSNIKPLTTAYNRLCLEYYQSRKKHRIYSATSISSIAGAIKALDGANKDRLLMSARKELWSLLQGEYLSIEDEYMETISWLKKHLKQLETLNIVAVANALTAIFFLIYHLSYLRKALLLLDESALFKTLECESEIRKFERIGDDTIDYIPETLLNLISMISVKWGYYETAVTAYQYQAQRNDETKFQYMIAVFDTLELSGSGDERLREVLASSREYIKSEQDAIEYLDRCLRAAYIDGAKPVIKKHVPENIEQTALGEHWRPLIKACGLIEEFKPLSLILSVGSTVSDEIKKESMEPPSAGMEIRYVTSLSFYHSETGSPIVPAKVKALNDNKIIVSEVGGSVYLCDIEGNSKLLWRSDAEVYISGLEMISQNQIMLLIVEQPPSVRFRKLVILDSDSGSCDDITSDIKCDIPEVHTRFIMTDAGKYLFCGFNSFERGSNFQLVSEEFTKSEPLDPSALAEIGDMTIHDDELLISLPSANSVYSYSLDENQGAFLGLKTACRPVGVARANKDYCFVTSCVGIGLQVYDSQSQLLFHLARLKNGEESYILRDAHLSFVSDMSFAGGDLLMTDHYSGRLHILTTS